MNHTGSPQRADRPAHCAGSIPGHRAAPVAPSAGRAFPAIAGLTACLVLLGLPLQAGAALGAGVDSIQADTLRLSATRRARTDLSAQVHTLTQPDGSTIRQFVGADGLVYAVAWTSRSKPRLDQLLGAHFPAYAQAGRKAMQLRAGVMHNAVLQEGDLVVEATAHLNAHVGRAFLRSRLPAGTVLDALR
jgi:hypothetical protein